MCKVKSVFTDDGLASVSAAVQEEIAAARREITSSWLDIDGIEHLSDQPGAFVYRLALSTPAHFSPDQAHFSPFSLMACHAAVRAGDWLTPEEIAALLEQRELATDGHHCPHGRPTSLLFTLAELGKQFRRT
jgi:DNA mismatch repair ATPase MutL